jgi:hypothetical protein
MPSKFMVSTNAATIPGTAVGTMFHGGAVDGSSTRILADSWAAPSFLTLRRGNGTAAAPSALAANDQIGGVFATGWSTAYNNAQAASLSFFASEAFTTASTQGTYITLSTSLNGTATAVERVRVYNDGGVTLGAPTGTDKGAGTLNTAGLIYQNNVPVLTGNQTITASGDATGSGTTALPLTLATVNSNVGTFQGLTINAKGRPQSRRHDDRQPHGDWRADYQRHQDFVAGLSDWRGPDDQHGLCRVYDAGQWPANPVLGQQLGRGRVADPQCR